MSRLNNDFDGEFLDNEPLTIADGTRPSDSGLYLASPARTKVDKVKKEALTADSLEMLLNWLNPDHNLAALMYEEIPSSDNPVFDNKRSPVCRRIWPTKLSTE